MGKTQQDRGRKLSFWVPFETKQRFDAYVERGLQGILLRDMYTMVTELLEEHGKGVLGLIMAHKLKLVIPEGTDVGVRRSTERSEQDVEGGAAGEGPSDQGVSTAAEGVSSSVEEEDEGSRED